MKKLFLFLHLFGVFCFSQQTQEIYATYKDFGFQKQPKKISKMHYVFKDKVAVDQAKETYLFDDLGNISSISEVNYNDNNAETITFFEYRDGLLVKECNQFPEKKHLQRCTNYEYNTKNQLRKKVLKADDGYTETTTYNYKNEKLDQIRVDFDSASKLLQELLYNSKGELYLIKSTETLSNGKKYKSTEAYLNGKMLFQRDEDDSNTFLYHKEKNMEIQFLVKGMKTLQSLNQFEDRLAKEDSNIAKDFSFLIGENFQKESELKVNNVYTIKRNESQDIIASATSHDPKKPLQTIEFQKIEYADGTTSGSEDFDIFIYNELNKMK